MDWQEIGRSSQGRPIYAAEFGSGGDLTLIVSGFHGNEKASVGVTLELCRWLARWKSPTPGQRVVVVPVVNPDGFEAHRRENARGVDLNRNFPTMNWGDETLRPSDDPGPAEGSEPETRAILNLVRRERPLKIVSLHDPLRVNNYDGPNGEGLAQAMAVHNRYPVKGYIGYPTPGSFGTWAGAELSIPMVTLEVPRGDPANLWRENRWALVAAIRYRPD